MFFLPPILGYAIMALATFFVASAIWSVIKHRTEYSALKAALACVAALYPLGLGAKVAGFGSEFLRWHVADIGFPVIIGYGVLLHLATNRHGYTWRIAQKLMVVALMMCYAYEVAAGQLVTRFAQHNQLIGSFDWVDIAAYTIGALAAIACMERLHVLDIRQQVRQVIAAQLYAELVPSNTTPQPRRAKPRTKHGRKRSHKKR